MKSKMWLMGWVITVLLLSGAITGFVYRVDPFFHFHKPYVDRYNYKLDNQRAQNDGITRNFDYDALITGTSMTENFKTSEFDRIFGVKSVKIPYSGAAYKEVNEGIERALKYNPGLKIVVRGIDMGYLFTDKDWERDDLGSFPAYLYDDNPFNDINYIFNKDIIFDRAYEMVLERKEPDFCPGMPSFDDYSSWQAFFEFGPGIVCQNGVVAERTEKEVHMTDEERELLKENVEQNITSLAAAYPQVSFYYFLPPYSMVWWSSLYNDGMISRYTEAERYAVELMLQHDNIKLFSYNTRTDITGDLNNYKDETHYGSWICTLILYWMHEGEGLITRENYMEYMDNELKVHLNYDYGSLGMQMDAGDDMAYGEQILRREMGEYE